MATSALLTPAPDDRAERLVRMRRLKMARSAHAYVRGSTARFYEWLDGAGKSSPEGPDIWICGDCHSGNLGPLADAGGKVEVQIRDLDQTVVGNPAHDLIRLGLSLASAARGADLPGVTTARMMEAMVEGYAEGLSAPPEADDVEARKLPRIIRNLVQRSLKRRWRHLAEERMEDVKPVLPLGSKFWALSEEERAALDTLFASEPVTEMVARLYGGSGAIEILDAAYWVKGCSSLGRLRYAVLVGIGEGESGGRMRLMDIKEAAQAAAPRADSARMPRENAERVVVGAKALSPHLGTRMLAARLLDRSVVLRELMPQDIKIELDRLAQDEAASVARYLGLVVGQAHGRQMDEFTARRWVAELSRTRSKTFEAPSWLWSSVVELVASHEAAYLDHCRRYALPDS
jgi:uncharacterized protein (DUF2252 family)